jgi:hypothetical protein
MTPLAYRIVKQSGLPPKHRTLAGCTDLLKEMVDIHCFEVSTVFDLVDELGQRWHSSWIGPDGRYHGMPVDTTLAFLPAPKTWIEWVTDDGRMGVLLADYSQFSGLKAGDDASGIAGVYYAIWKRDGDILFALDPLVMALRTNKDFEIRYIPTHWMTKAEQVTFCLRIYAMLALINSPKVIGRRTYPPHKTAIKQLAGGHFPLYDWTEIKLDVVKPPEIDDGEPHEAHLTGRRALHFCRAHVRIRLGRLEYVSAHWRGDPSIGIKQSRYAVVQPP